MRSDSGLGELASTVRCYAAQFAARGLVLHFAFAVRDNMLARLNTALIVQVSCPMMQMTNNNTMMTTLLHYAALACHTAPNVVRAHCGILDHT